MAVAKPEAPLAAESAAAFATEWAANWSRCDYEAVLAHFAEDCVFESQLAEKYAGTTRLVGKAALRDYWRKAVTAIGALQFTIDFVAIAEARRAITIVYRAQLGERQQNACERLIFDEQGRVTSGMAFYGPPISS